MAIYSNYRIKILKCISRLPQKQRVEFHLLREFSQIFPNKVFKCLFFGSDYFSLASLTNLHELYRTGKLINKLEVVTLSENNAIYKYATKNELKIHEWPKIEKGDFHLGVIVSFGRLIPSDVIQSFPLGMINVHASLLPRWRGAAPIIHALKNGDKSTGISIMKIKPKKFDIGDILAQEEIPIGNDEKMPELHQRLAEKGGKILVETISKLPEILDNAIPQNEANATYAPKITQDVTFIKWKEMTAKNVYDLQRAIYSLHDLRTTYNGMTLKLFNVAVVTNWEQLPNEVPGCVTYSKKHKFLLVKCKENHVSVKKVLFAGRPAISALNFYQGYMQNKRINHCFFKD